MPAARVPYHERIEDPAFRRAVDLLDAGDTDGLRDHLVTHPGLIGQRVKFDEGTYFSNPCLLEFAAENPIRRGRLPENIVEGTKVILDAGGRADRASVNYTLALVGSGRVPRECGVQIPLIDLLCDYGADPARGLAAALTHGEFAAVDAMIRRGAPIDLLVAAATGRTDAARQQIGTADGGTRHRALALAAQHGHADIVRMLLDAGEDPNRFNPPGFQDHSTPLHQAALAGHGEVVRLLVERGARLDIEDTIFQGTPQGWAEHGGHSELAAHLRELT